MNVGQLIEKLKEFPEDAEVVVRNIDNFENFINDVYVMGDNGPVLIDGSEGEEYIG